MRVDMFSRRYIYRISFSVDGNHSLRKKNKKDEVDDVPLSEGEGFFVLHADVAHLIMESFKNDDDQVVSTQLESVPAFSDIQADAYMQ